MEQATETNQFLARYRFPILPQDKLDLALVAWREVRGEGGVGIEAIRAVMHVILNRCVAWRQTIHQVIFGKNQFTSMQDSQANLYPKPNTGGQIIYDTCVMLANQVLDKEYNDPDPTDGALYYFNPATATSEWFIRNIPKWTKTVQIGHHVFYKP